ncbi:MAG: zinc-dependent metalloprotease [Armatimonadota bacterium]|nr:zinc-dependent metalloprotease [Armatimonadota bacterium]
MKKFAFAISLALFAGSALAQDEFVPDKGQTAGEVKQDDPQKELKEKIKKYEDLLQDSTKHEGPYTFYTKVKEGKTELFIELLPDQVGKVFFMQSMLQSGVNADGLQAGEPASMDLAIDAFRFDRNADDIRLVRPNLSWRWSEDNSWAASAKRSFPEGVLETLKIEAEHPETKKIVIKATGLFSGGLIELSDRINKVTGKSYQYDRDNSGVSEVKAFPENLVIRTKNFYTSSGSTGGMDDLLAQLMGGAPKSHLADGRSLPINVTYMIFPKRETGYEPRFADTRVGYFTQDYIDTTKPLAMDKTSRMILRWDMRKNDPNAAMSDPVKPIVFWIDDSIPVEFRKATADGILRWNKTFEKVGISNAIVVKQKPADADWDHADMRFNVIRMIRSENAGYAVAWPRWDPYTGEIINASISMDAAMIYGMAQEYSWIAAPAVGTYEQDLARVLHQPVKTNLAKGLFSLPVECRYGETKATNASFGLTAMELIHPSIKVDKKKYLEQAIEDVISHEMGHILGLRHNFVASKFLTPEQLANPAVTAKLGLTASVMDYTPVNIFAIAKGSGDYYSPVLGVYDFFAIEYGYKDLPGDSIAETAALKKIASRAASPGLAFMTDENADSFDPYVVRFDNSSQPLVDAEKEISIAKLLLANADAHYPRAGRPFSDLTRVVNLALRQTVQQSVTAVRFVGGVHGNRNFKGDPHQKATLAPVAAAAQRSALALISRNLFAPESFKFSERMLMNLSGTPFSEDYNAVAIKDVISGAQRAVLSMLLSGDTVSRVANNSFKWGERKDKFTLTELYGALARDVYSEVGTGKPVDPLRRDLQRFLTDALIRQSLAPAGAVDNDARMMAFHHLRTLGGRLQMAKSSDATTQIHLKDLHFRVNKALNSVQTVGGSGGPPPGLFGGG